MNGVALNAQAVVVAALLVHQMSRTWERGLRELGYNHAPVFAVHMPDWATAACQALALPLSLTAALWSDSAPMRTAGVALTVLWVFSVQQRLANHAWLGGVSAVAFAVAPAHLVPVIARDLLAGVYLSAALFKLHGEYLFSSRSAGRVVLAFYFKLLGLRPNRFQLRWLPGGVVLVELAAGILLLTPHGLLPALLISIAMHTVFGVSGNFPFSIVALALWSLVMSPRSGHLVLPGALDNTWWAVPGFALLGLALGRTARGSRSAGIMVKDTVLGAVFGLLCTAALSGPGPTPEDGGPATVVHFVVGALFLVNCGLVVTGVKLEWSFAMFSSLRPFGRSWLQRGGRSNRPRYYLLTLPERLPKTLLRSVPADFLYQSTRGTHAVHEAVAHRLEDTAAKHGLTFQPMQVVPSADFSTLVPAESPSAPCRTVLLFPAIIPKDFSQHYLG
ncbi:hypothetical protein ABTY61_38940 [Kitasatospora sp. NPDC096128]|uniref:hypothetical protein n=1 Tax=Kitasatospora sp. NPDC096128 TaxID=3155547 RepID=UPI00333421B9